MEIDSNAKLAIINPIVNTVGAIRVKPSDFFMEYAHATSKIPATNT